MKTKFTDVKFLEDKTILVKIFDYDQHKEGEKGRDIICRCLENDRVWEPFQTEITTEILKSTNGIFVDVGCHIGYYSILASLLGIKSLSFDLDYDYLNLFESTKDLNNLNNIKIFNQKIDKKINTKNIIKDQKISLLKIDTGGLEFEIITKFLDFEIPYIITEISSKSKNTYIDLCKKMKDLNYRIYNIGLSPQRKLKFNTNHLDNLEKLEIDYQNLDSYISNIKYGQTNFLFINLNYQ